MSVEDDPLDTGRTKPSSTQRSYEVHCEALAGGLREKHHEFEDALRDEIAKLGAAVVHPERSLNLIPAGPRTIVLATIYLDAADRDKAAALAFETLNRALDAVGLVPADWDCAVNALPHEG